MHTKQQCCEYLQACLCYTQMHRSMTPGESPGETPGEHAHCHLALGVEPGEILLSGSCPEWQVSPHA